jgi:hypothetical protein
LFSLFGEWDVHVGEGSWVGMDMVNLPDMIMENNVGMVEGWTQTGRNALNLVLCR